MDDAEDAPIIEGDPETWAEFCDRVQRHIGAGSRVFVVQQPPPDEHTPGCAPMLMILVPGPFRPDFLPPPWRG